MTEDLGEIPVDTSGRTPQKRVRNFEENDSKKSREPYLSTDGIPTLILEI